MLSGIDISNWNSSYIINHNIDLRSDYDFVIMKASEGINFKDPYLDFFYDRLHGSSDGRPDPEALYGFYHYARPEYNPPEREAQHFLNYVQHHAGHAMYALDVEGNALYVRDLEDWCLSWLSYVYAVTGVKPLIYCSESELYRFRKIAGHDFGLWVAKWSGGKKFPKCRPWKHFAIWQYQASALDYDFFNGTREQFKKYCERSIDHGVIF